MHGRPIGLPLSAESSGSGHRLFYGPPNQPFAAQVFSSRQQIGWARSAAPRAVIPYYPSSPTTAAMRVDPHLIVAFARAAANRELPSNSIVMGAYGICGSSRRGKIDRLGNERGGAVFAGEPAKTS